MKTQPARLLAWCLLGALAVHTAGAATPDYVPVAAGSFDSVLPPDGKSGAALIEGFRVRATPVSNAEFLAFLRKEPQWRRDRVVALFAEGRYLAHWPAADAIAPEQAQQPVTQVSWFAAQAFCAAENARLPTWHEWEFVAAADATRADARSDPAWRAQILNWYAQTSGKGLRNVGGVAKFYGARDVHGLVWEWVSDTSALMVSSDNREQGDPDLLKFCGAGALSMQDRDNYAVLMRIAMLSSLQARDTTANLGFRCAIDGTGVTP